MAKMTYANALTVAINTVENTEVREKLEALKVSLERKNSGTRKPTANQKENASLKEVILESMEVGKAYTITEIMKLHESLATLSNQRVSAIVRQMVESGTLKREEVKRRAYFSRVEG